MKRLYSLFFAVFFLLTACHQKQNVTDNSTENLAEQSNIIESAVSEEKAEIAEYRQSFIACGDNIIYGTKQARLDAVEGGRTFNYKTYYSGVSDIIEKTDIAFINQETLMCGDGYSLSYYPMFNSPQDLGYDLQELGFDVVNIANNHMLDKGADGLQRTIEFWKGMNVLMIGGYENQEDFDSIRIYEKEGLKIAFLSYTYATNGITKAPSSPIVIPYIDDDDIIRQASLAREAADLVFASVHWGDEGSFTPNDEQRRVAQLFADCGIDVIIGHHPHVIQPVEWLSGVEGNKTLCVYSLGNFMAQQDRDYNMVGGIIGFDIVYSEGVETRIENPIFTPTAFHFNGGFTDNNVYRFEDYTPELAAVHGVRTYYGNKLSYDDMRAFIDKTINSEFLPEFYKNN